MTPLNEREAQEVVRMVESGWSCDFGMDGRTLWCRMLYAFDAELATLAVVEMSRHPLPGGRFKPQVSDLRTIIISLRNRNRPAEITEQGKWGTAPPEWVWVWSWARFRKNPPEERAFPQQDGFSNPDNRMSKADYAQLVDLWRKEGSPKSSHPVPGVLR